MFARLLRPGIEAALRDTPAVFLRGARQSGKSTLARQLLQPDARYVTFDDDTVRSGAELDMQSFVRGLPPGSVIDEVQRLPQLFPTIKLIVDEDRQPGRLILTGSADVAAIPTVAESLAGRVEALTLRPLAACEIRATPSNFLSCVFSEAPLSAQSVATDRGFLLERLTRGGFPEVVGRVSEARRAAWFDAYLATIVQHDIDVLADIDGLQQLPRLLELLAQRAGSLLNQAELSRTLGLPATTTRRYLALLQATFLIDLVPAWSNNATVRLRKSPKIVVADSGLVAALRDEPVDHDHLLRDGSLLENFVATELQKLASWSDYRLRLSHYREERSYEVDFVLERGRRQTVGIEVKASATLSTSDARGLLRLGDKCQTPSYRGILLYGGAEVVPFGKNTWAVPIAALWVGLADAA